MKIESLFNNYILPIMGESKENSEIYLDQVAAICNIVLADCFDINNNLRLVKGKPPLPPLEILDLQAEIPFEQELVLNCLTYGVAVRLLTDEAGDEGAKLGFLETSYNENKRRYSVATYEKIANVWGDGYV